MTKLSDTQLVILSAAAQREDRNVLPLPGSLRGGAATKVVGALLKRGLIAETATDSRLWPSTGAVAASRSRADTSRGQARASRGSIRSEGTTCSDVSQRSSARGRRPLRATDPGRGQAPRHQMTLLLPSIERDHRPASSRAAQFPVHHGSSVQEAEAGSDESARSTDERRGQPASHLLVPREEHGPGRGPRSSHDQGPDQRAPASVITSFRPGPVDASATRPTSHARARRRGCLIP